jgi:signal transduction histidine kinase
MTEPAGTRGSPEDPWTRTVPPPESIVRSLVLVAAAVVAVLLLVEILTGQFLYAAGLGLTLGILAVAMRGMEMARTRHRQLEAAGELRARRDAELFDHMVGMLDEEREAIAHRLHDGPLQVIAAIRLMADAARRSLEDGDEDSARRTLTRLEEHASSVSDDLRRTTGRLHPVVLEQRGLLPALESLIETVNEEYGTAADLSTPDGSWRGSPERDMALYQLAREAAVSAARSGAMHVHVGLERDEREVRLVVSADGDGVLGSRHDVRTQLLAARAARIGGSFELADDSTRVVVRAPA